ncbi:MAG: hypothetical protein LWW91_02915 [Bacteroidales bacterium]|jgi:hypothetical protein|nr:hypothetical protein [Bacteroidales bacterium]OJX87777.1 MAG: hypothetical protein BGP01_13930 [Paludibacter sp. 47-17]
MEMKKLLLFLPLVVLFACTEPQPPGITLECKFINKSGVELSVVLYQGINDTVTLADREESTRKIEVEGGFDSPFFYCDSIGVIFNPGKKVLYKWSNGSARNPLRAESYAITKINEHHFLYQYTFTEQDYLNIPN